MVIKLMIGTWNCQLNVVIAMICQMFHRWRMILVPYVVQPLQEVVKRQHVIQDTQIIFPAPAQVRLNIQHSRVLKVVYVKENVPSQVLCDCRNALSELGIVLCR
eukprot:UN01912